MKFKLLFIFLCVFTTSVAQDEKIEKGWAFYQKEGKWGVLYKGEPCLLPRFDGFSGSIEFGRFAYKEKINMESQLFGKKLLSHSAIL